MDSSVAARLAMDMGYECTGCTMRLCDSGEAVHEGGRGLSEEPGTCLSSREKDLPDRRDRCPLTDIDDAGRVAGSLGIPYYVFDLATEFRREVMERFVEGYSRGMTPNPCIECNRRLKFGALMRRAAELGCEVIVTGHYARIEQEGGRFLLKKAADRTRDQSYVLYGLTQEQLSHTLFPLGGMKKREVRELAAQYGFVNADKPDSQDICFVADGDYASAIEDFTGKRAEPGDFVDTEGRVLGKHRGLIHYTVGQHRHLGIETSGKRYVLALDAAANRVIIGGGEELFRTDCIVSDFNWVCGEAPAGRLRCMAKVRYRQQEAPAVLRTIGPDRVRLSFDEPVRAITPGQSAVVYDGDTVLGGGIITSPGLHRDEAAPEV